MSVLALAVVGSTRRLPDLPNVPTMAEVGIPGFEEVGGWAGLVAPLKTPAAVMNRINEAMQVALKNPQTLERFRGIGAVPTGGTVKDFETFVAQDGKRWAAIIKAANIPLNDGAPDKLAVHQNSVSSLKRRPRPLSPSGRAWTRAAGAS
jgi:tripartite-type tricarboxylate transporter receptor subunit TctC